MTDRLAAVVLAAGRGTRMKSDRQKVLHPVAGKPMIDWALDAAVSAGADPVVVVTAPDQPAVRAAVAGRAATAIQERALGTGDAVKPARAALAVVAAEGGTVLVLYGDTPMITPATLARMVEARAARDNPAVVVLGFEPDDPALYGRLVLGADHGLDRIVEARDAGPVEREIGLCNGGVMAIDAALLFPMLDALGNANAKGEYYLTDIVDIARSLDRRSRSSPATRSNRWGSIPAPAWRPRRPRCRPGCAPPRWRRGRPWWPQRRCSSATTPGSAAT